MSKHFKKLSYYIRKYGRKNLEANRQYIKGVVTAVDGEPNDNEPGTLEYGAWLLGYDFHNNR